MTDDIYKKLVQIPYLNLYTKVFFTALELEIFDCLKDAKTSEELAMELKLNPKNTEYFLNALYSLGLLSKDNSKFQNVNETNKYLITTSQYYFGEILMLSTKINDPSQFDFANMVKNGSSNEMICNKEISFDEMFQDMKDSQSAIRQTEITDIVCNLKEYPNFKRILDLGCGAGLLGMSVISSRDDITGVLFDKPPMAPLINQCIEENDLMGRVDLKLGDYVKDDIGNGYDFVLAVGTLNFAKNNIRQVLKKIYDSLNDGGVFMTILDEVSYDYSTPKEFVISWLPYALNGMDLYLTEDFIKNEGEKAGFSSVEETRKILAFGQFKILIFKK